MEERSIQIACEDTTLLFATVFKPACDCPKGVVIICSALGLSKENMAVFLIASWPATAKNSDKSKRKT